MKQMFGSIIGVLITAVAVVLLFIAWLAGVPFLQ
jgi:hypothetical protein